MAMAAREGREMPSAKFSAASTPARVTRCCAHTRAAFTRHAMCRAFDEHVPRRGARFYDAAEDLFMHFFCLCAPARFPFAVFCSARARYSSFTATPRAVAVHDARDARWHAMPARLSSRGRKQRCFHDMLGKRCPRAAPTVVRVDTRAMSTVQHVLVVHPACRPQEREENADLPEPFERVLPPRRFDARTRRRYCRMQVYVLLPNAC